MADHVSLVLPLVIALWWIVKSLYRFGFRNIYHASVLTFTSQISIDRPTGRAAA